MQEVDLMVDFETLAVSRDACLLSAGIVVFNWGSVLEEIYAEFDVKGQIVEGKRIDERTVKWWRDTDKEELARLIQDGVYCPDAWLSDCVGSIQNNYKVRYIWSRGSMDFNILSSYVKLPYWIHRDCRTLDVFEKMEKKNNHNALDDCLNQVAHVQGVMKRWNARCVEERCSQVPV